MKYMYLSKYGKADEKKKEMCLFFRGLVSIFVFAGSSFCCTLVGFKVFSKSVLGECKCKCTKVAITAGEVAMKRKPLLM